ncbi:MAG: type IV pilus assembly protein PilM, partial [Sedimentisphaerales bacterium]|nr:type IV pilus assembly protein PilM [Sedimentisphaerales bacterium]
MPKSAKVSWGIDIGNCTLKALKLGSTAEGVEVLDYAVIKHEKILSQPDVDESQRQELVRKALTEFLAQHDVSGAPVIVSVPGHNSFARFIKLPPVESKRITEIVRFEAIQQIPFDINDVEWDWQAFTSPNDPEVEVGIFAIKRDLVKRSLEPFSQTRCPVHVVQMAPMALYNYLHYDYRQLQTTKAKEAIILLDIGAENTDLVIADGRRVWQRSIPIGGNQFTAAVQKAFKLGFAKAEAIKRSAGTSKYARQIFQAMRSVFADLAAEIQRSLGFYSSGNRDVQFREVLALGNAMRLPGLPKFLQQSLSLPIKRLDSFEAMKLSPEVSVAQFTENLPSLAVAYGLALQGLGKGTIDSNLLPTEIARQSQWQSKRRWFVAASALFLLSTLLFMFRSYSLKAQIESQPTQTALATITTIKREVDQRYNQKTQAENQETQAQTKVQEHLKYYQAEPRRLVPLILQAIQRNLPNEYNTPQQKALFEAYRKSDLETVLQTPRPERRQVFLHQVNLIYTDDLNREFDQIIGDRLSRKQTGGLGSAGMSYSGRDSEMSDYPRGRERDTDYSRTS